MPTIDCGFEDFEEKERPSLLAQIGPTIPVQIGFDPGFDEFDETDPILPSELFPALVDTGASSNSIDAELASSLRLPVIYYDEEVSGSAGKHTADIYIAQIHIPELNRTISGQFVGVRLAAGGQLHRAIIGRSFLRDFVLRYDGRTGQVTLSDD